MLLNPYSNVNSSRNAGNSSPVASNSLVGVVASNSDGDTFQLSDAGKTAMLSTSEMYDKMDADGDGSVTQEEFVAARPDDVTEEMAANLYNSFDTDTSGSLTESEFETAMNQAPPPPPPPPGGGGGMGSSTEASQTFSELDTNQDGVVSAEELAAARPEDVTKEMAANLFKSLDTDGSGGLTETEYAAKMGGNAGAVSSI
jgi:Ca2+-binding EF-hand superfamily protein